MTRIKICGITRSEDTELCVALGVDAIGLIFHPGSPRSVNSGIAVMLRAHIPALIESYPGADAPILDSAENGRFGGTGRSFDFTRYPDDTGRKFFLAGGLGVDSIRRAILQASPYGIDASSRLESEPGVKKHNLVTEFVTIVRETDGPGRSG